MPRLGAQVWLSLGEEVAHPQEDLAGVGAEARLEGVSIKAYPSKTFPVLQFQLLLSSPLHRYWVCLKGTTLLFYRCDCGDRQSGGGHIIEARPRHLIFVDACLVQAIPEHPKRDYVFCLSTAFGDAHLLDAPCLVERDHWIAAIHCACAAQLARSSPRAVVSHVLHWEIRRLEEAVELDERARAESESIIATALAAGSMTASEAKQRQQTLLQAIHRLEEKVEKNRTEIFRFRAYLAA